MRYALASLIVVHGLIHSMGFAKAFGYAQVTGLQQPVPRLVGALWLVAALLLLVSAAPVLARSSTWWMVAAPAVMLSQILITSSWTDAKFGTLPNLGIAVPLLIAMLRR